MRELPGHPFDLGAAWRRALAGETPNWTKLLDSYVAAVDWPASLFWHELSVAYPDALVLLSLRDTSQEWWESADATILPYAHMALAPNWKEGRDFLTLLEKLTGTKQWDDPATFMSAYERHNATVRATIPAHRLLEWRASEGWPPICKALDLPIPEHPFPLTNKRSEWKQE